MTASSTATSDLRDRLLDAAEACFRRYGIANTTIDDVVREAKVPRATLYRHAGNKNELIASALTREIERFLKRLGAFVATNCDSFASTIVDGTIFAARDMATHEPFRTLFTNEPHAVIEAAVAPVRAEMWKRLTGFVAPLVTHAHETGEARPELTVEDATEWLQRCIRSLVEVPHAVPRTDDELRSFLERMLLPAFVPDDRR
ncbi:MAG TPA: TetR/AcrR family transcriptional regulator [Acidimicrobiales bacterium]|nr:TetR/AcrR family transcriptional regulator [Acidimicrobiales bacterium]